MFASILKPVGPKVTVQVALFLSISEGESGKLANAASKSVFISLETIFNSDWASNSIGTHTSWQMPIIP